MADIPRQFDPQFNPDIEYIPYDEDPAILTYAGKSDDEGRLLASKLGAWASANHELSKLPDSAAALSSKEFAEMDLDEFLASRSILRSVREKKKVQGDE